VIVMNRLLWYWVLGGVPFMLLQSGCFGAKAPSVHPETQLRAETTLYRGIRAEQRGDSSAAEELLIRSLSISSSIEDDPARTMALINLARLYRQRHELPKAESCIDQAVAISKVDSRLYAEVAYEKALLELAQGRTATALEWAQKAITGERGDMLGSRLNLAARIQLVSGTWKEADELARKALAENRSVRQAEEEANSLRIMGIVARNENDFDRGALLLQEALQIDKRIGKSSKIAADLGELAETARSAGKLRESAVYLERAYEVNRSVGRLRQAMENLEKLAGVYTAVGEEQMAARAREAARRLAVTDMIQQPGSSSATINPSSRP
jgi:tetratricopeptide (TPR) repeat protein